MQLIAQYLFVITVTINQRIINLISFRNDKNIPFSHSVDSLVTLARISLFKLFLDVNINVTRNFKLRIPSNIILD